MDWCGRVGEVTELFRREFMIGCHWVVPKIFSMPDRVGHVYFSPPFKFMKTTWYFGIYRYSRVPGQEEWIGVEVRRCTDHPPTSAQFSIGLMHSNETESLIRRNETFPSRDNVCCIDEFLPMSDLLNFKDRLTRSDALTITCVLWPGVPLLEECNEFWNSQSIDTSQIEQSLYSVAEAPANTKADRRDSPPAETPNRNDEPDPATEVEVCDVDTTIGYLPRNGALREISRGVEWEIFLPPLAKTWSRFSPEFTCGPVNLHFFLHSSETVSNDFDLGFTTDVIVNRANVPPLISWRVAVKNKDDGRMRWIMSGHMDARKEHFQHAPEIRIGRNVLESFASSLRFLTLVYQYSAGEVHERKEVATQTENTGVSCESHTEDEPGGAGALKELKEHSTFSLSDPEKGGRMMLIGKKPLEPDIEKYLSELPKNEKYFMFAA